ncbi:Bol3 protein [Martiniozyma asiatica (nom. inval.)]|nr:Bol3 protein [Martiniozyma asiatica]
MFSAVTKRGISNNLYCLRSFRLNSSLVPPPTLNEEESQVFQKLNKELNPSKLDIQDLSGGCGQMYYIEIESAKFSGLTMIKQHRLVQGLIKEEVSGWHGVRLKTTPKKD